MNIGSRRPLTSVLICTYDMGRTIGAAIRSALLQSDSRVEILIVDDGSVDDTWQRLQSVRKHPRVRLFRHESRRGVSAARNLLIAHARGDYLSILDADDQFLPGKTLRHRRYLEKNPDCAVVWGPALTRTPGTRYRRLPTSDFRAGWDLATDYQVVHSTTTWRKSAVERIGGYNEKFVVNEDVDLFLRIGDDCRQAFLNEVVAYKHTNEGTLIRKLLNANGRAVGIRILAETMQRRYVRAVPCE